MDLSPWLDSPSKERREIRYFHNFHGRLHLYCMLTKKKSGYLTRMHLLPDVIMEFSQSDSTQKKAPASSEERKEMNGRGSRAIFCYWNLWDRTSRRSYVMFLFHAAVTDHYVVAPCRPTIALSPLSGTVRLRNTKCNDSLPDLGILFTLRKLVQSHRWANVPPTEFRHFRGLPDRNQSDNWIQHPSRRRTFVKG